MIKAIISAAAVLLVLQIGLTVAVHQQETSNLESTAPDSAFLSFTPDSISSIIIKGPEEKELLLEKKDKGWIMPDAFSAPASQHQVESLLRKLADARQGLAVATSKGAAKRFKTTEDDFKRHVILKQGESIAGDFYLGTSGGMRNSHVRKTGQDAVFTIPMGSHEVDAEADSWLDRTLADLDKNDLKALVLGDISLTRKQEDKESIWALEGADKEETDKDAVDSLLNKVTAVSVQSVLDPATSAELFAKDPAVQFTVTKEDDSTVTYAFAKNDDEKNEYFVLKMSDSDLYFKVGKWLVEGLTEAKREKLLVGSEEKEEEAPAVQAQEAPQVEGDVPEQDAEQETEQEAVLDFLAEEEDEAAAPVQEEADRSAVSEEGEKAVTPVEPDEDIKQNAVESAVQEQIEAVEQEKANPDSAVQEDQAQPVEQNAEQETKSPDLPAQE